MARRQAAPDHGTPGRRTSGHGTPNREAHIGADFFIQPGELSLRALQGPPARTLSFAHFAGTPLEWREACREKLSELLGYRPPAPGSARLLRTSEQEGVTIEAWVMAVDADLHLPAYLLVPRAAAHPRRVVIAIHGHGEVEPCLGLRDDYHHSFALRLAQAGHLVLCPELRGFGALGDMARTDGAHWLDYWVSQRGNQFTLATDAFMYGATLIGQTVEDLLRWEDWLAAARGVDSVDVAGISYGGDLALTYPPFSTRTRRIYASGTLGSFTAVFARCYNAPAHCIPGVLQWMDRSDIAGLNAPRPIRLHYGERDRPGPKNASASYNETVAPALAELRAIYGAFGAEKNVSLSVTPGAHHEMDIPNLLAFLSDEDA
jgi:dienelactone hydrolase